MNVCSHVKGNRVAGCLGHMLPPILHTPSASQLTGAKAEHVRLCDMMTELDDHAATGVSMYQLLPVGE